MDDGVVRGRAAEATFDDELTAVTLRALACRLVVALTDRGLELAFDLDPRGDPIVVRQLGDALIAVLEPYIVNGAPR